MLSEKTISSVGSIHNIEHDVIGTKKLYKIINVEKKEVANRGRPQPRLSKQDFFTYIVMPSNCRL